MKFTTSFFTVLAATATDILAETSTFDCNRITNRKYSKCIESFGGKNYGFYENYCIEFETENCQKFYNNSLRDIYAEIPECKGDLENEEDLNEIEKVVNYYYSFMKIACARDEQDNYCPHSFVNVEKTYDMESLSSKGEEANTIYMKYVNETCKSKKCIDDYLSNIEDIKQVCSKSELLKMRPNEKMQFQKISSILKSDTCTAKIGKTSVNVNGNANASNVNTSGVNASSANANGNIVTTNGNVNNTTNASNSNDNGKTDATNGATQITISSVLFASLAILLLTLN